MQLNFEILRKCMRKRLYYVIFVLNLSKKQKFPKIFCIGKGVSAKPRVYLGILFTRVTVNLD